MCVKIKTMSETNGKIKLSALLMASLITANFVCANDTYKNNVVDVRLNKESGNAVKVTIYTDKPYTEPVVVNKKSNNKYVILMPETKSSLKSAPSISNMGGTVSDISVNTQSVSGGKGYTKIIITSDKVINVVPRTQQLLTSKKPNTQTQAKPTATKPTTTKPANTTKTAVTQSKTQSTKPAQNKVSATTSQKPKTETPKKVAQTKTSTNMTKQKQVTQPKPAVQKVVKQPIEVLEQEIKTDKNTQFTQDKNDTVLNNEINENLEKKEKELAAEDKNQEKNVEFDTNNNKKSISENIKAVLKDYQGIEIWKLLLLAGAITFPIIVIMIILGLDKKINKRIDRFRKEEEQIQETPFSESTLNQTYVPPVTEPVLTQAEDTQTNEGTTTQTFNSFDEMLNRVDDPLPTFHEEQLHQAEYEKFEQSVTEPITPTEPINPQIVSDNEFENDFADEDFEHDFSNEVIEANENVENVIQELSAKESVQKEEKEEKEEEESIQSEEIQPINEEQLAEEEITESSAQTPATTEPYNPDGYLSDFNNVNDKDFFDELTIQSMAVNNVDGLPEQSPADEIFDFMTEDETFKKEETVEETDTFQNTFDEIKPEEEPLEEPQNDNIEEDLTMLTEVKLNDSTGIYLVNYENFSSLVGHINDDYFVIKKFDEIVNGKIFLKETEKLKDSTRYLVRVGKNKMVVEVSDTSMNRLLDL